MIYIYLTGSDDSGADTAEEYSTCSTDIASKSEGFTESIVLLEMLNCFKMYVIKMKEKNIKKKDKKKKQTREMKILK